ncbi:MAG: long-chain-acyl-CoA synthetase [Deltaproteobacteria bacterium]|nr:MAG: long-chain-acyl-CoA synthetase [Deltaproteobacteria bacterium]
MGMAREEREGRPADSRLGNLRRTARNALELLRRGRIGAPWRAAYEVVHEAPTFRLRHYAPDEASLRAPLVLVPPLMLTAEVYDISPELSAVEMLRGHGVDTWVVDFGAPEREEGGLQRTLDDHVLAVAEAVRQVAERTGEEVHLAGYSQGGMFAYQAAAWLRGEHLASVITFGSPVDIRRALPLKVHDAVAEKVLRAARDAVERPLSGIPGLPGFLTSSAFKLLSARKEVEQIVDLFASLPDRARLQQREARRRFLNGEGFVAWPGPALRQFLDEVVANNRMARGGLVVRGKPITLADIRVPVLAVIGSRDELVRPAAVRGIHAAAPHADVHEFFVPAGHFGLVVGSVAMGTVWPGVLGWLSWSAGEGELPDGVVAGRTPRRTRPAEPGVPALQDQAAELLDQLWRRLGDVSVEMGEVIDALRFEFPRLARLRSLGEDDTPVSVAASLRDQARALGPDTCLLWGDRAFSWLEVDDAVDRTAAALHAWGLRAGDTVALLSTNRPELLACVLACNRLGVVAALLPADARGASLAHAVEASGASRLLASPDRLDRLHSLGGALPLARFGHSARTLPRGVFDLERLRQDPSPLPADVPLDAGMLGETALLLFTSGTTGLPKAARITNRRWVMAALGGAAACRITPADTVYVCLPLQHATSLLLGVGSALLGGARLALAPRFSARDFWEEVRRHGVSVVFYVGEMLRFLTLRDPDANEARSPVRLFAGNGLREDVWRTVRERFGPVRILEFYASTEGNVALANLRGEPVGSVGRPLPGQAAPLLAAFDAENAAPLRDDAGQVREVEDGEPGLLLSRIDEGHPLARFDGYADPAATEAKVVRDVREAGDAWFNTGDVLRRDTAGHYHFVDRVGDTYRFRGVNVSTEQVTAVLHGVDAVAEAVVYGIAIDGVEGRVGMASLRLREGAELDPAAVWEALRADLPSAARPRFLRVVRRLPRTSTFKAQRRVLQEKGADPRRSRQPLYGWDTVSGAYVLLDARTYDAQVRALAGG